MAESPQLFDICIVCALYEEASTVIDEFQVRCSVAFSQAFRHLNGYEYRWSVIGNNFEEPLTVLVAWLPVSGPVSTASDLWPLLYEFHPRFAAMTGICAGYKEKVCLGDLVIAEYAYHYEEGKIQREEDGEQQHQPEMKTAHPTDQVIQYAKGFDAWREPVNELKHRLLKNAEQPERYIAPMASGMAVRADNPFPWLIEYRNRKTLALDMEAAAFYLALRAFPHTQGLVVKGVCDYADMQKKDDYHDYAARASAVYLLHFIREYVTNQTMPRQHAPIQRESTNPDPAPPSPGSAEFPDHDVLAQLEQLIQAFKALRSQIAGYVHLKGPKGFTVESCENQYNRLYADTMVFLTNHLPESVSGGADGFVAIVQGKSAVKLRERDDLFVSFARAVISPLAKFEKLAAQIDACTTTLEMYKQKHFSASGPSS